MNKREPLQQAHRRLEPQVLREHNTPVMNTHANITPLMQKALEKTGTLIL